MRADLHVFAARANPLRWQAPDRIYKDWAEHMLDSGVTLHVIECQYGDRPFTCALPHVDHIGVRAKTMVWSKENLLRIGMARHPEAHKLLWCDTDVFFRRPSWVEDASAALDLYDWIQPWDTCYDLGPNDEHLAVHRSFCSLYHRGAPVAPNGRPWWKSDGGPYEYAHSGYCHGATRQALEWVGGLFEVGGMGSGDYHMALGLVGQIDKSVIGGASANYMRHLHIWQDRAVRHINRNIGYTHGTIEHRWHGRKSDRGYLSRWEMFLRHGFDPDIDLKRNTYGIFEWAGNKPELRREFDLYLRSRAEDANTLA